MKKTLGKPAPSTGLSLRDRVVLGCALILCGILYSIAMLGSAFQDANIIETGEKVQGTVTEVYTVTGKSAKEDVTVSYPAGNGIKEIKVTTGNTLSFKHPEVGDAVTVYYDPFQLNKAVVLRWENKPSAAYWGTAMILPGAFILISSMGASKMPANRSKK